MAQRPAWFRLSSVMRPSAPAPVPPPAPAPNPPPPAPIQTLMRPSFQIRPPLPYTQNQDPTPPPPPQSFPAPPRSPVQTPAPPPRSPTPVPSVAPVRPPIVGPTPTEVPPRSPVVTPPPAPAPAPAPAPPHSPISPTTPAVAPPRSLVATPSRDVATPPAAQRSPIMSAPSPSKAAIQQNSISPNFPESSPSVPNSPKTKTQSSPMPNSPISKSVSTNYPKVANLNGKGTSPNTPPERTPAQSPKVKPLARLPPPLPLPPAQINESEPKIEQKTVLVQESIDKPNKTHVPHNSAIPSNGKPEQIKHDKGASANKKLPDSQGSGMRVITLAGENRGAVMQLSPSNRKNRSMGKPHTLNKSNSKAASSHDDQLSSESGEEGKSTNRDKAKRATTMQSPPMSAYLNSNVQGVNNSILYNFTSSHNDPGVHLSLNRKANGNRYFKEC